MDCPRALCANKTKSSTIARLRLQFCASKQVEGSRAPRLCRWLQATICLLVSTHVFSNRVRGAGGRKNALDDFCYRACLVAAWIQPSCRRVVDPPAAGGCTRGAGDPAHHRKTSCIDQAENACDSSISAINCANCSRLRSLMSILIPTMRTALRAPS